MKDFFITAPACGETVYPYIDQAKAYLLAGEKLIDDMQRTAENNVQIKDYCRQYIPDAAMPVNIQWSNPYDNIRSYTILYAPSPDFFDTRYIFTSADATGAELYNLYKATDYYVKVIAVSADGTSHTATTAFRTTDLGPRIIHLEGAYNTRDLGGYLTLSGKRTMQGLLYRSGQLDDHYQNSFGNYHLELTHSGRHTAQKELGIVTDLDFRSDSYPAAIPGAKHVYVGVEGYNLASPVNQKKIREVFSILSHRENYPLLFHCQGGADRTGTIAYLINALLGVSELDLARDYEFTSFSIYGLRSTDHEAYIAKEEYRFYTTLREQKGDTLPQKTESYLLGIGVSAQELDRFRSIMFTGR